MGRPTHCADAHPRGMLLAYKSRSYELVWTPRKTTVTFKKALAATQPDVRPAAETGRPSSAAWMSLRSGASSEEVVPIRKTNMNKKTSPPKTIPITTGAKKQRGRPFAPGNTMGRGRPKGSLNKTTLLVKEILGEHAEEI